MSINKLYFEAHPTCPMFEELATFLGIDLSAWEFANGMEDEFEDETYITVVYAPKHTSTKDDGFLLTALFVFTDGEWQIQQFRTDKD